MVQQTKEEAAENSTRKSSYSSGLIFVVFLLICGLPPLVGASFNSFPWELFWEFPPHTKYVSHADFSPWIALFYVSAAVVTIGYCLGLTIKLLCDPRRERKRLQLSGRLSAQLFLGLILVATSWYCSWSKSPALETLQIYVFFFLWLGYIVSVDALGKGLNQKLTTLSVKQSITLFLGSAILWWGFEYLNRFMQNWSYPRVYEFSPWQYFLLATLAFSTVLPAIAVTAKFYEALVLRTDSLQGPRLNFSRATLGLLTLVSVLPLFLLPQFSDLLFPFVWLSPLLLAVVLGSLFLPTATLQQLNEGSWKNIYLWSMSGLTCGLFWELWNLHAAYKWVYNIPYAEVLYIFEMPFAGYAGYLPFGILCGLVIEWLGSLHANVELQSASFSIEKTTLGGVSVPKPMSSLTK